MTAAPEFDVLDGTLYDDPWEVFRWLRNESPVHWDAKNEFWLITKQADIVDISKNPKLYSSADGVVAFQKGVPISIITMDDPEHNHKRRFVSRGFTPRRVRELGEHIREITKTLLDEMAPKGEVDFLDALAAHVPLWVIAEMLGFNPEQRDELWNWSDAMMNNNADMTPEAEAESMAAVTGYAALCTAEIAKRRENPTNDIISLLLSHEDELEGVDIPGERLALGHLDENELLMFLVLLMVAGNETTRNAIAGGLMAFRDFPDEKQKLLDNPELIDLAVDEIVRWVTPVLSFYRTATADHELRGQQIKAGDRLLMLYGAANRDEEAFDDPDVFRVDRDPNPHVGFGIGAHYCLGANLARVEIKVVFEELFKRLPDIRVPDGAELERKPNRLVLAIERLPAIFTPA